MLTLTAHQFSVPGDAKTWGKIGEKWETKQSDILNRETKKRIIELYINGG